MATPTVSAAVRDVLTANPNMPADDVIAAVQRKGVTAPPQRIRESVHNVRSELRKKAAKAGKAAPAAAAKPRPAAAVAQATSPPAPAAPGADLSSVLKNVALVNAVVGGAGGVDAARAVAEAVRACGGVDHFLQHLDTVAGIRGAA